MQPPRKILLNPGPATTSATVKEALVQSDICPREREFGDLMQEIATDLVRVVSGDTDEYVAVLFAGSGTAAMEACVASLPGPGKKILIVENGAYGTRMRQIAEIYEIPVVSYRILYGDYPDLSQVEALIAADDISHVFVVHHETTTGMLNPVADISRLAFRYGREIVVDAMSSLGGIPINVQETPYDYIISSANKCLQGMPGLSFVICKRKSLMAGGKKRRSYYLDLPAQYQGFHSTHQMPFTPPVQVAYALRQALREFFAEGQEGRSARYRKNFDILYAGLKALGFGFLLPPEQESGILLAVCEMDHPAFSFDDLHDFLYARGFTIYPGKGAKEATFRLSILGDLYPEDIHSFLKHLKEYLVQSGIPHGKNESA